MHKERRAGKVDVEEWVERVGLLVGAALGCGFRSECVWYDLPIGALVTH
jgi:hypothetical protein